MTLHKELVAAFRKAEPQEVGDLPSRVHEDDGYFWRKVDYSIVINAAGEIEDVEGPPWRLGGRRRRNSLQVPQKQLTGEGGFSGFLWGQSTHALGIVRVGREDGVRTSPEAFNRFRTFHRAILGGAKNPSIRAFLMFLQRWDPESADPDQVAPLAGSALVFRFRYDDCFLHESHAARLVWARLLHPAGGPAKT